MNLTNIFNRAEIAFKERDNGNYIVTKNRYDQLGEREYTSNEVHDFLNGNKPTFVQHLGKTYVEMSNFN